MDNDLVLVVEEEINALDLFTGETMDPLVERIRRQVLSEVPDVTTVAGRKRIASLAFKVAASKVMLDNLGKNLVADWKKKAKRVDEVRKKMRDDLDVLRDEVRQPLTDWGALEAEAERQKQFEVVYDAAWDEARAEYALRERERIVREKEEALARQEAERQAKEAAERAERERAEREERIAKEAAERARREAAEAAEQAERRLAEQIARERARAEQADRERIAAEQRAQAEKEAAVRAAEQRARDEAERRERERLAKEEAERQRQEKLAANKRHQAKVDQEALESMVDAGIQNSEQVLSAIKQGLVRHVAIQYGGA